MIMNWNNNDTNYIIKKIIIGLCMLLAFTILTTWKAKAYTINKPNRAMLQLIDSQDNVFFLSNTNITDLSYIGESRFYDVINYNNSNQLQALYIFADFVSSYEYQVVEFKFGVDVDVLGDVQDVDITDFYVEIPNYVYQMCGIQSRTLEQRLTNQMTAVYNVHCVASQPIQNINMNFQINRGSYATKHFFVGENINVRGGTEEEISDILKEIQQEQAIQQQWLNNTTTDDAEDSFLDNFLNNSVFSDTTGLQSVITLPLHMVSNLSSTCQPINLTLPIINGNVSLPCMSTIYTTHFNGIYVLISVVINGFFIYRILLKIYQLVHDAKDPTKDKLEVVEL